jgi:hypothetical protein
LRNMGVINRSNMNFSRMEVPDHAKYSQFRGED